MRESNQTSSHMPAYHCNAWALGPFPTSPSGWWNVLQKLTLPLLLMLQLGIRLPDTSSNGWAASYLSLVAVTDPIHLPRLIKCHECPFLNYLKLLTSPSLFIRACHLRWEALDNATLKPCCRNAPQILTRNWYSALTECFQCWLLKKSTGNKHLMD